MRQLSMCQYVLSEKSKVQNSMDHMLFVFLIQGTMCIWRNGKFSAIRV